MSNSLKVSFFLVCMILISWCGLGNAGELDTYWTGYRLFSAGHFVEAADSWLEASKIAAKDQESKKSAFGQLIATLAYEKGNDARAYQSWSATIQTYLQIGTSWEIERKSLQQKVERLSSEIRGGSAEGEARLSLDELLTTELDNNLHLTTFNGPKIGLKHQEFEKPKTEFTVSGSYYARPLEGANSENPRAPSPPSTPISADTPQDSSANLGMGIIPVPDEAAQPLVVPTLKVEPIIDSTPTSTLLPSTQIEPPPAEKNEWVSPFSRGMPVPTSDSVNPDNGISEEVEKKKNEPKPPLINQLNSVPDSNLSTRLLNHFEPDNFADTPLHPSEIPETGTLRSFGIPTPQAISRVNLDLYSYPATVQFKFSALPPQDMKLARSAWKYFESNLQVKTGLFNSVQGYKYATLWDIGSSIAALVSAEKLNIISHDKFIQLVTQLLNTLNQLTLYNQELPNREYDISTGNMLDIHSSPSSTGSGWSALDIGRTMIWLKIAATWHEELREPIATMISHWKFDRLSKNQEMNGAYFNGKTEQLGQEGRFGYEQYATSGYQLWGVELPNAQDYDSIKETNIEGETVYYDTRNLPFLTSDPFYLGKIELGGIDKQFNWHIRNIYALQKKQWQETGVLTAVGEDSMNRLPWFSYENLYWQGDKWIPTTHTGSPISRPVMLSSKAALAWSAIYPDKYSPALRLSLNGLIQKGGVYAGIYANGEINKSLNINTNAVILEILLFKKMQGKSFLNLNAS